MKKEEHYLNCEAPICAGDPNQNYKKELVWYSGEKICQRGPYEKFQKVQVEINKQVKKGKFKNIDKPYTANDLEKGCI